MRAHGAKIYNGTAEEALQDSVTTHVLVNPSNERRCRKLNKLLAQRRRGTATSSLSGTKKRSAIVSSKWVDDCISDGCYSVPRADGEQAPKAITPH